MTIKYFKDVKTFDELKKAYRDLMKKYHPDLNKGKEKECTEIAKVINSEFEYLFKILPNQRKNKDNEYYEAKKEFKTPQEFMNIINKIIIYKNIQIDIVGSWIWVSGETKPIKEILKELNFKWHDIRKMWYLKNTNYKSTLCNLTIEELKNIYGGTSFSSEEKEKNTKNLSLAATF